MPFTKLDVKNEINKKKMESKTFEKAWNESREEYELIGEMIRLRKEEKIKQVFLKTYNFTSLLVLK
nr:hypothetical protein [uncultured Anaerobutyricum sp.]